MSHPRFVCKLIAIAGAALLSASQAFAVTYQYVGSWHLGEGPEWWDNPPVYSGQEAAALLFGGSASDYAISTISANPNDINFSAWLDGWSDDMTYAGDGTPGAQDFKYDAGAPGYNDPSGYATAYSAYVRDHYSANSGLINYAFQIIPDNAVPDAGSTALLLGLGLAGAAAGRRRRA